MPTYPTKSLGTSYWPGPGFDGFTVGIVLTPFALATENTLPFSSIAAEPKGTVPLFQLYLG